ncbi:hypothetical protein COU57_07040 [Candidatus Pacearchaeota archaeon CG10_big_fil_rev_8_21_14_0_10_32_14]|nr:MAG: hypothetical protein COU57_07040 [Candidatus Pacearchaeota archaeon CG10_big_fil_rev_8_21_14_0_10_32_14]
MDKDKLKLTSLQREIFALLCMKVGQPLSLREIAKISNVSPTAISKSIPLLEKEKLIKKEEMNNSYRIELNTSNHKVIQYKRVENLRLFYESGLANFMHESFPGRTIILFGSYSLGGDTIKSDIDIAIIGGKEKPIDTSIYDKILERKISLNFYDSFKDIHRHLKDNILNGIVISGGVQL